MIPKVIHLMTMRRLAVLFILIGGSAAADLTPNQRVEVFNAVWSAVNEHFYDPGFRGVHWQALQSEERERFRRAGSDAELQHLTRHLLGMLKNSHLGFITGEERRVSQGVLPFLFEASGKRVFVIESRSDLVKLGDEVLNVDGKPAESLRLPVPRYLQSALEDPYFGQVGSTTHIEVLRKGKHWNFSLARVKRSEGFDNFRFDEVQPGIGCLRLRAMPKGETLRRLLVEAAQCRSLILDLRNCPGGDLEGSLPLVSFLLGPGVDYYKIVPRGAGATRIYESVLPKISDVEAFVRKGVAVQLRTFDFGMHFSGPLAVLVNGNTASEAEDVTAELQERARAKVFGARTNGALNGWSLAVGLPYEFGAIAIPYTRTLTSRGRELEGRGIEPDRPISNSPGNLRSKQDHILKIAAAELRLAEIH